MIRIRIRNFDPGSWIRDGKFRIRDKHPGYATLQLQKTSHIKLCNWVPQWLTKVSIECGSLQLKIYCFNRQNKSKVPTGLHLNIIVRPDADTLEFCHRSSYDTTWEFRHPWSLGLQKRILDCLQAGRLFQRRTSSPSPTGWIGSL